MTHGQMDAHLLVHMERKLLKIFKTCYSVLNRGKIGSANSQETDLNWSKQTVTD